MATVAMSAVPLPGTSIGRATVRVTPSLFYVVSGVRVSDSTNETWVSRGVPDLRATTHTNVSVLGQWYSAD